MGKAKKLAREEKGRKQLLDGCPAEYDNILTLVLFVRYRSKRRAREINGVKI